MNTFSNSSTKKTVVEEVNSIFVELFDISKNFLYKHHKIIGYF